MVAEKSRVCRCCGTARDDAAHIGQEAHVEHAVGLVQHQHFDARQVDGALADMIEQATGAGHDDFGATPERGKLAAHADAAVDGDAAQAGAAAPGR